MSFLLETEGRSEQYSLLRLLKAEAVIWPLKYSLQ